MISRAKARMKKKVTLPQAPGSSVALRARKLHIVPPSSAEEIRAALDINAKDLSKAKLAIRSVSSQ